MSYSVLVFLAATCAAGVTDVVSRRIPNVLTYGAMAFVLCAKITEGPTQLAIAATSLIATIVIGSMLFGAGWIGGGDIKLIAVGAGAIGYPHYLVVLLYIAVSGGVLAIVAAAAKGRLRDAFARVAVSAVAGTSVVPHPASSRIPYALAICAGACFYAASESIAPWLRLAH